MKKIFSIIVFVIASFLGVFAQSYTLQSMSSYPDVLLELYPNKSYIIKISHQGAPDLMMSNIFSFGDYVVDAGGTYTLTDKTHNYTMKLEIASESTKEKVLLVKESFGWMENNYFVMSATKPATPVNITENFLSADELIAFREKNKVDKCPVKIKQNKYVADLDGFSLNINKNETYTMYYYTLPVSKGKWSIENNFLVLLDGDLNSRFYAIVRPDGTLRSALLPGEFSATNFKISEK